MCRMRDAGIESCFRATFWADSSESEARLQQDVFKLYWQLLWVNQLRAALRRTVQQESRRTDEATTSQLTGNHEGEAAVSGQEGCGGPRQCIDAAVELRFHTNSCP